jgi:SAM-dependent methyltransferase
VASRVADAKALLRRRAPRLARWIHERRAVKVKDGWEGYARSIAPGPTVHLGDEWNQPEAIGLDCEPSEVVTTIDEQVIAPFLGTIDTALEIGAGGGRFTVTLIPKAKRVIATEVSPSMLRHLRARFGHCTNVEYLLLDGKGLRPIADGSVDAVLSYGVFTQLLSWDIYNYLLEIERVLRPGGKAVIGHSNTFSELGWRQFLEDWPDQVGEHKFPGSFTLMTPDAFASLADHAGLAVVECVTDVVKRDAITLLQKRS